MKPASDLNYNWPVADSPWPWKTIERPAPVVERIEIIDEPHNQVFAQLRADGTVELSATRGDPYEYASLRPGQLAKVARDLTALVERANDQANAPKVAPRATPNARSARRGP